MKQLIWIYTFIGLLLLALLSVLSYGAGSGYVYLLWHGVQVQTNLWVLSFSLLLVAFVLQLSWVLLRRYLTREKRKLQQVLSFQGLHPYEQLGVLWLLEAEAEQAQHIEPVFNASGLMKEVVQATILARRGQYAEALSLLKRSPPDAFELAEIQRIEIYLAQQDAEQALTHLEFLNGHALSPWLVELDSSYTQKMQQLWGTFAIQFPLAYLSATQYGQLAVEDKAVWLTQLLGQFEQATAEQHLQIQQRYAQQCAQIQGFSYELKTLWLKLLFRLPDMAEQHNQLAIELLAERFDQDVFYLWFQQQLLKQRPDYSAVEQQIKQLENKYPSVPVLSFALWHIYMATQREKEATELLSLFPNNILMNYLRIKANLNGNESLIKQLNLIFQQDTNFIQVKI